MRYILRTVIPALALPGASALYAGIHLVPYQTEKRYSLYVIIEETSIYPTDEQAQTCLRICQMLSSYYRDIQLFRFDERTGEVYIFASDELQIIVPPNEPWRFVYEAEI